MGAYHLHFVRNAFTEHNCGKRSLNDWAMQSTERDTYTYRVSNLCTSHGTGNGSSSTSNAAGRGADFARRPRICSRRDR